MIIQVNKLYFWVIFAIFLQSFLVQARVSSSAPENKVDVQNDNSNLISLQFDRIPFYEVADEIEQRSSIIIELAPLLDDVLITADIQAKNWESAIAQLLKIYNRAGFINKAGQTTRILVTGVRGNGKDPYNQSGDLFSYLDNNSLQDIPDHLKNRPTGSVIKVKFNKSTLKTMSVGDVVSVSLPVGQFNIINDNLIVENDDDFTWTGYLEDVSPKQRVVLSFDKDNSFGKIPTPNGIFRIETSEGIDWLINVNNVEENQESVDDDIDSTSSAIIEQPEIDTTEEIDIESLILQQPTYQ